ncbi:cyclophilin-like fold protein [Pseudarthrobacter sp. S9]|uniref:cyclophilin-like fold protein n=1 Tax=Pseudarthrobacter sp. S9 TaxID=3418421 RepID=UPI003CFDC919
MSNRFLPKKALRPGVVVPAFVVIAIALAGCTYSPAGNADTRSPSPGTPAGDPTAAQTSTSATTPIVIELDGQKIAGELDGSATSASLLARLPLTLSFRDHGGQEKISELPAPLDLDGAPKGSDAAPLAIGYYVPEQSLVLYYQHVGYFNGIVPIGTYEETDAVRNQTDEFTVTIRKAD